MEVTFDREDVFHTIPMKLLAITLLVVVRMIVVIASRFLNRHKEDMLADVEEIWKKAANSVPKSRLPYAQSYAVNFLHNLIDRVPCFWNCCRRWRREKMGWGKKIGRRSRGPSIKSRASAAKRRSKSVGGPNDSRSSVGSQAFKTPLQSPTQASKRGSKPPAASQSPSTQPTQAPGNSQSEFALYHQAAPQETPVRIATSSGSRAGTQRGRGATGAGTPGRQEPRAAAKEPTSTTVDAPTPTLTTKRRATPSGTRRTNPARGQKATNA
eukprot:GHVU01092575.1.p1 GENE.GHVU01092575.1~~GHVU01092575.1.p1  ORF type:complete len:268 (+),score=18.82 GHVU01092575.1:2385-3188(+)